MTEYQPYRLPIPDESADRFSLDARMLAWGLEHSLPLGKGSSCVILEGYDNLLMQPVAVKVLKPHTDLPFDVEEQRIQQEVHIMRNFPHKHILPVYGITHIEYNYMKLPAILMAKAEGDITTISLEQCDIVNALHATAEALDYLHTQHIAHMSVKGENVLFTNMGNQKHYWLADFGSAIDEELRDTQVIANTYVCAPELWRIKVHKTWNWANVVGNDIHQLGVMAYRLLTHRNKTQLWYDAYGATLHHMNKDTHLIPDESLSANTYRVLRKATSYDPLLRHATCQEFSQELEASL